MAGGQRTRIANSCDRRVARGLSRALGSPLVGSSASRKGTGKNTLESRSGTEREIGGIRQLPLNVFNAAVEARKRSAEEKRSVALSLSLLGGDGAVWAGCGGAAATPASCSSFDFSSLSIYVPGGIAIAGPRPAML